MFIQTERTRAIIRVSVWVAVLSLLLAVVSSLATALAASAHAALRSMSPAAGSRVTTPPTEVVLTFTETVGTSFATVTVTGDGGRVVSRGRPAMSGNTVTQPLEEVGPGRYTVAFRVVSQDGHPISQKASFTVALLSATTSPPATTPTSPSPSTPSTSTPSTSTATANPPSTAATEPVVGADRSAASALAWGLGAAALAAVAAGAVAWNRRRRSGE